MCCGSIMSIQQCALCSQVSHSENPSSWTAKEMTRQLVGFKRSKTIASGVFMLQAVLNYITHAQLNKQSSSLFSKH